MNYKRITFLVAFNLLLLICFINGLATAENNNRKDVPLCDAMQLEVNEIELEVGETYTFHPIYKPDAAELFQLLLTSGNESVVKINEKTNTIEAIGGGTALIYAESFDRRFFDICTVTVNGSPLMQGAPKGESAIATLDNEDIEKIDYPALTSFLDFAQVTNVENIGMMGENTHPYKLFLIVKSERKDAVAEKLIAAGATDITVFQYDDSISCSVTADQLASVIKGNPDIIQVIEDEIIFLNEPDIETEMISETLVGNAKKFIPMKLNPNVDILTDIFVMRTNDVLGRGITVAILDTGLMANHVELTGKVEGTVIHQACFTHKYEGLTPVCQDGQTEYIGSALPVNANDPLKFNHGTHVTGIAAGQYGIAPAANIIAYQVFSELKNETTSGSINYYNGSYDSDQKKALENLITYVDANPDVHVAAVNMSLGSNFFDARGNSTMHVQFEKLLERGILPVVATGNSGMDGKISSPAMDVDAIAVGALDDSETPKVATYSNHASFIDIMAPGTNIKAPIWKQTKDDTSNERYSTLSGTSMATPMVTGALALFHEVYGDITAQEAKDLLMDLAIAGGKRASRSGASIPALSFTNFVLPPTELSAQIGDGQVSISFTIVSEDANHIIYVYQGDELVKSMTLLKGKNSGVVTGLVNNTKYRFSVKAVQSGIYSPAADITVTPLAAPKEITAFNVNGSDGTITVHAPESLSDLLITVYRSETASGVFEKVGSGKGSVAISAVNYQPVFLKFTVSRDADDGKVYESPMSAAIPAMAMKDSFTSENVIVQTQATGVTLTYPTTDQNVKGYTLTASLNANPDKTVKTTTTASRTTKKLSISNLQTLNLYCFRLYKYVLVGTARCYSEPFIAYGIPAAAPTGVPEVETNITSLTVHNPASGVFHVYVSTDNGKTDPYTEVCNGSGSCDYSPEMYQPQFIKYTLENTIDGVTVQTPLSQTPVLTALIPSDEVNVISCNKRLLVRYPNIPELTGYYIEVFNTATGKRMKTIYAPLSKYPTEYSVTGLVNNTDYRVQVTSYIEVAKQKFFGKTSEDFGSPTAEISGTPDGLAAMNGDRKIILSFSSHTEWDGQEIRLTPLSGGTVKTIRQNKSTYTLSSLKNGEFYRVELYGYNSVSPMKYTENFAEVKAVPLPIPTQTRIYADAENTVTVQIADNQYGDGFSVYYRVNTEEKFKLGCSSAVSTELSCSFPVDSAPAELQYFVMLYKSLEGVNYYGPGAFLTGNVGVKSVLDSNFALKEFDFNPTTVGQFNGETMTAETAAVAKGLSAPSGLVVTNNDGHIECVAPAALTAQTIKVYRSDTAKGAYELACEGVGVCSFDSPNYQTVYLKFSRVVDAVESPMSTAAVIAVAQPKPTPSLVSGCFNLLVEYAENENVTGYYIEVFDPIGMRVRTLYTTNVNNPVNVAIAGLKCYTAYTVNVRSYVTISSKKILGPWADSVSITTNATPSTPIEGVAAIPGDKQILLDVTPDLLTAKLAVDYTDLDAVPQKKLTTTVLASKNSVTLTKLTNGHLYYMRLYKYNTYNRQNYEAWSHEYAYAVPLTAPKQVNLSLDSRGTKLTVTIDTDASAEGLAVYYKAATDELYELGCRATGNSCSVDVSSAQDNSDFLVYVMRYVTKKINAKNIDFFGPGISASYMLNKDTASIAEVGIGDFELTGLDIAQFNGIVYTFSDSPDSVDSKNYHHEESTMQFYSLGN